MKKAFLIMMAVAWSVISIGQSHPNNLDIGLFNNGANGSNGASGANLAISLRIKPGGLTYTAVPAAEDFVLYLVAPKTAFDGGETVNIVQVNASLYGTAATTVMLSQGVIDIGDPNYWYLPIVLNNAGGMNLSSLAVGTWAFAFTINFTPAKTPAQYSGIRIIDQNNNAFLSGFIGAPTYTTLQMSSQNQLTTTALVSLPASLLNFSGYKSGSKNVLKWTTANEQNNQGFEVQRSVDGINYTIVGFVHSQAAGGNSSTELGYGFDDNTPPVSRKSYYRLNQRDIDGRSRMSNVVVISGDKATILGIGGLFPNPASTLVNVVIDAPKRENITLVVMDLTGKTVKQQLANVETGSNTIAVDINNLAQGSYLVKVLCKSDCETTVAKFNKQ